MQLKAVHYYIERKIENINLSVCTANSDLYSECEERHSKAYVKYLLHPIAILRILTIVLGYCFVVSNLLLQIL